MIRHGNDNMTVADRMQRWTIAAGTKPGAGPADFDAGIAQ